ncbi:MAG: alpha-2-macroglobulin domain protein, partial [Bryobacterales bacterium]|nr:alpha-2-macroglobulin domain protein [Bryobacterales bacterium]
QGESVAVTIEAKYFFGEPVAGARVKYSIHRSPYWFPLWYDPEDDEDSQRYQDFGDDGDQLSDQDGRLDTDGKLTVTVPTSESDKKQDFRYRIEVKVADAAQREITGTGWLTATYGSFLLNVTPDRYVVAPGSRASFGVEARDYDNKPVRTRSHVELVSVHYHRNQDPDFETIASTDVDLQAAEPKKVEFTIPKQGGSYQVRASAKTAEGRTVTTSTYLYVYGGGADFGSTEGDSVKIVADRKTYKTGDTARLMIVAGKPNTPVFITVEGRDLREYKVVRSKDSTVAFELPVSATEEPGITVSAAFIRDGAFHNGTKYLRVPPVEHELTVKLGTSKPQYKPGETADYNFEVTDAAGKAVPRAEFSLGVVDEAIYSVRKDAAPSILSFFFGREYSRVSTENSLQYYFSGQAGTKRMQLAAVRPRSRLAQLKPESLVQPKVRTLFPDTALWVADLTTDERGRAHAQVVFPDSLTTWRATARGITPDTRVGGATVRTIVRKNLILRLATPRFLVQGDEVVLSAIVHNYLAETKTARVSLDMEGLDILEGATRDVSIPSRGEVKVDWRVRAQQVRHVRLTGKALTNEESDALELEIPVNIPGVKLSQSKGGSLAAGSAAFELTYPERVEPGSRSLTIRVSPSIVGSLLGSVEYLTAFPYGCVEQTMSSFLPNIIVRDAVSTLGLKVDLDSAALQEKIRAGLDRLYSFQHSDGGWGWWETDDTHAFMTAYVVAGLVQAKGKTTEVHQDAIDKGANWLKKNLAGNSKLDPNLRAYMIYALALAGQPDAVGVGELYQQRSKLSAYGQALLGLTLEQEKDGRAAEIAAILESRVEQDAEQAWWTATRDSMLDFDGDVTPEATAYVVKLLSHQRKDSPLLPKAALWLMNHRNEGYWWSSTKQTAMVMYGLTDYLKVTNELSPRLNVTVYVNDTAVLTRRIEQVDAAVPDLILDESKLKPGANRIRVTTSGDGRLYYSARAEYYSRDPQLQRNGSASLNILRNYFRLVPVKKGDRITWDTTPLQGPVAPGDVIAVQLTVTGSDWKYLLLEDPIPAGTEFIERDNLYELNQKPAWWTYSYSRRELHDDRMAIFQTYFGRGQQQYFYLLKVVNGGSFDVSPARVAPMYQQGVMATTETRRLEVR